MFDTVLGRDAGDSRWCSGAIVSVAVHAAVIALILWLGARAAVPAIRAVDRDITIIIKKVASAELPLVSGGSSQAGGSRADPAPARRIAQRKIVSFSRPSSSPSVAPTLDSAATSASQDSATPGTDSVGPPGNSTSSGARWVEPTSPRQVPSFVFDRQLVAAPEPHLPQLFLQQHPHQTLQGEYRLCVDTDGRVVSVTALTPIPGADEAIIQHLRKT